MIRIEIYIAILRSHYNTRIAGPSIAMHRCIVTILTDMCTPVLIDVDVNSSTWYSWIMVNVSSTYLNHTEGGVGAVRIAISSNPSIYRFAIMGDTGDPVAAPCFCLYITPLYAPPIYDELLLSCDRRQGYHMTSEGEAIRPEGESTIIICIIMGDFNHGNIKWDTLQSTGVEDSTFLCLVQDDFLTQHVLEPTRAARVLDIVLSSQKEFVDNVEIQEPLGSSDHNQLHFNINIKSDITKVKQCRRDFRKSNYMEIRKSLAHIDWDEKMKNKTATECWDILRGELDRAIDSYVPMKMQGKRSKKKHLSKEAFRKMIYKQNMWRVYKHTGKDKDYEVYKEALNAATNEVRKAKRNSEHKLAQNIKSDSKSFYAYVRSKQNVRDKVGPLKDNAGNIITQGCLMAEELNVHFSSVFTREDTSSLPVPETKFNGSEEEKLGQLNVTPEVVELYQN